MRIRYTPFAALMVGALLIGMTATASAEEPATYEFWETWARTDLAVAEHVSYRTWMWGPDAISGPLSEEYIEAPDGGWRLVQYFDKSRMEITDPYSDPNDDWYVTNGLLAKELITGEMQFGDNYTEYWGAAEIPVAGDYDDDDSPTYASFANKMHVLLDLPGVITRVADNSGLVWEDDWYAQYGVYDDYYVVETNHRVASVFWEFMNSDGPIWRDGGYMLWSLFENPFYATGYPITEAYWAEVKVGGVYRDVLMQCFERRCLTYTPDNPDGFKVEAGNIGLHYYVWNYGEMPPAYQ
jgi:hypothetical protein